MPSDDMPRLAAPVAGAMTRDDRQRPPERRDAARTDEDRSGAGWTAAVGEISRREGTRYVATVAALAVAAIALAWIWTPAFYLIGVVVIGALAYAATRWPRATIVAVVMTPLVDQYVIGRLIPSQLADSTRYISEIVLLTVGLVIAIVAARRGLLLPALRHPVTLALGAFFLVAATSAVVNGVPFVAAVAGLVFVFDAMALFFLPRMVGFQSRHVVTAVLVFLGFVTVAALFGIAQPLLRPDLLGFRVIEGRYGESVRAVSFLGDPGLLGALVGMTIGFPMLAVRRLGERRMEIWAVAIAFVLMLVLVFTFSRASWLGLVVGFTAVAALVHWRAIIVAIVIGVLAVGTVTVMPRNLLAPNDGSGGVRAEQPNIVDSTIDRTDVVTGLRDLRSLFIENALPIIADHPVVGVGPARFGGAAARRFDSPIYEQYGTNELFWNPRQQTVDSAWLQIVVEFGILGTLAFLAAFAILGIGLLRAAWRATGVRFLLIAGILSLLVVTGVNGLAGMVLEGNPTAFALWFFLGVGSLLIEESRAERARTHGDDRPAPLETGAGT